MLDLHIPKFRIDQRVRARVELRNDGSHPQVAADALLAGAGAWGVILRVGRHAEAGIDVYLVEFDGVVLGCTEDEIADADSPREAA